MPAVKLLLAPAAVLLFALASQDQKPPPSPPPAPQDRTPQPPPGAQPLPQIPDVPMTPLERKDLWQRFTKPSPLTGTYRLIAAARGNQVVRHNLRGYLMVSERYLAIQIHDETTRPGKPAIQASVREYSLVGARLQTTGRLGVRIPAGEDPVLEGEGLVEMREILLTTTTLRVLQGPGDYLEFERVD